MIKECNYHAWDYRKGFRLENGKMTHGLSAMTHYTIGYIKYWRKKWKNERR